MVIMNTARMGTGRKGVKGAVKRGEEFPAHFGQFRFLLLPVVIITK